MVMKIETSFDHAWLVCDHLDKISSVTGAGIRCPDLNNLKELPKKYCIWIRGSSLDAVYVASTMLNVSWSGFPEKRTKFKRFENDLTGTVADAVDGSNSIRTLESVRSGWSRRSWCFVPCRTFRLGYFDSPTDFVRMECTYVFYVRSFRL